MVDDVALAKAEIIQRTIARARAERAAAGDQFATDFTHQDAAILNVTRACEAAIQLASHLVATRKLGLPTSARDAFELLARAAVIDRALADPLQAMVGFRNVAVHAYRELDLDIAIRVIDQGLDALNAFSEQVLRQAPPA